MRIIGLTQNKFSIVDDTDYEKVSQYCWTASLISGHWRAVGWIDGKKQYLHRFLMNYPTCKVDHVNGNTLDNQRSNLRLASNAQNSQNRRKILSDRYVSKYKGVSYSVSLCYVARIKTSGKTKHIGVYATEKEAALAYDEKAICFFGEFAKTNKQMYPKDFL